MGFLGGRHQKSRLEEDLESAQIPLGVSQGSVLGPFFFTLYTTPLSNVITEHSIPHHLYADDSLLYVSFSAGNSSVSAQKLKSCLASVPNWMLSNKLKLNPDKTKFLLTGHKQQWAKYLSLFRVTLVTQILLGLHETLTLFLANI